MLAVYDVPFTGEAFMAEADLTKTKALAPSPAVKLIVIPFKVIPLNVTAEA